ncbi:MAG: outer membrane protein assembly factor BamE [Pseudomonadota bacterium]
MIFRRLLMALAMTLLTACVPVYKIDIQQGNLVTQEMVSKLKKGMSRDQVRFALGTPLVTDPFHPDRWDYVYRFERRGRLEEQRRITVIFENDRLARIEGDVTPAAGSPAAGGR